MNRYIWSAVGVVVLAYVLMGLVKAAMPLLIVGVVIAFIYRFVFMKRW